MAQLRKKQPDHQFDWDGNTYVYHFDEASGFLEFEFFSKPKPTAAGP